MKQASRSSTEARERVEPLVANKVPVPVDIDSIFDEGTFEGIRQPFRVILVEGDFQSGKSTLAYHYCQKWARWRSFQV